MDMFEKRREDFLRDQAPLADRMRPRTLDEFIGQEHIVGPGRLLRRAIQIDQLSSVIFYGPPGTGKTTLARIVANTTKSSFLSLNAVLAGVADIRKAIQSAKQTLEMHGRRTILFIDEVHRFNKAQQDALLPHVESGLVILIGATTENPYFEVNKPLVSRSRIFQLKGLTDNDLRAVARQALEDRERGYGQRNVRIDDEALDHLVQVANGDARSVLNALELAVETTAPGEEGAVHIDRATAEESIQQRAVLYDKEGDVHYDTISAFIKSIRGSDPDAALYWMGKMVYAGEDPRFIFRRMLILAGEDVGMADPKAMGVVMDAARAFDYVGMPEGRYHLAHACLYLATAPKSNSSMAFFDALGVVSKEATDDVPDHLRDASRDAEGLGHGEGYLYPHAYRDHWVAQQYLPDAMQGKVFYQPSDQGYEKQIHEEVARRREAQVAAMVEESGDEPFGISHRDSRGQWIHRTSGSSGDLLGRIRDQLFRMVAIGGDSLVLDLDARTGLLTFYAARMVSTGGVWALAHSRESYETLTRTAETMPRLERPQVLRVAWEDFDQEVRSAAGKGVAFDAIVGRSVIGSRADKRGLVERTVDLLRPRGVLALAETVPSRGQRISALCDLSGLSMQIREAFLRAEESLFADSENPLINWSPETLENELREIDGVEVQLKAFDETVSKRIVAADIDHWFRTEGKERSLGKELAGTLGGKQLEKLRTSFQAQLANRTLPWKTLVLYLRIQRSR